MAKILVIVPEIHYATYEIEADDIEDAKKKVNNLKSNLDAECLIDVEFGHALDKALWAYEEKKD